MSQTNILLESGTNELEIVEFYVNQNGYQAHYGINVAKVVEIIRPQTVTAMPEMRHPAIKGAFSHRNGRIVPLIDMAQFLGYEPVSGEEDSKVIVTEFNHVFTAFLVSGVNRIYRLSWTSVEAPGTFLQDMSRSSVVGVVRLEERVVFLLDLEAVVGELEPSMAITFTNTGQSDEDGKKKDLHYTILQVDDSHSIRELVRTLFIGNTGSATVSLPAGSYVVKAGTGMAWYGEEEAFGEEGRYEVMTFDNGRQELEIEADQHLTVTVNAQGYGDGAKMEGAVYEDWSSF